MTRQLHETAIVRVSVIGSSEEGLGTQTVTIDLDEMDDKAVGRVLAMAFRRALSAAVLDFSPKLEAQWKGQPERFREGDSP